MKSTTCIAEITNQKNEKDLSEGRNPLACLPLCLLASCQPRNFLHELTEKCFAVFDKSSCAIYLMWYWALLFFGEFSSIIPFMVWLSDSNQIKGRGYIFKSSIICKRLAEVIFFSMENWISHLSFSWSVRDNFESDVICFFFKNLLETYVRIIFCSQDIWV